MLVIADASPLIAFEATGHLFLLKELFRQVAITSVVRKEIYAELPDWILTNDKYEPEVAAALEPYLDAGEASAIALAIAEKDALLVIAERKGRHKSVELGVRITGSLGIVMAAKESGLIISGTDVLSALEAHGMWISPKLKQQILINLGE